MQLACAFPYFVFYNNCFCKQRYNYYVGTLISKNIIIYIGTIAKKFIKNAKNNLLLFLQIADLPSDISFSKTEFLTSQNKMLLQKQTAAISNSVIRQMPKEEQKWKDN